MKTLINTFKITALTLALVYSNFASATIIPPLLIDFRDAAWSGAYGQNPFTVGATTAKTRSSGEANGKLYQDATDGLGVMPHPLVESPCSYEQDEIDSCETLIVSLDQDNYMISDVWVTDLFAAPYGVDLRGEKGKLKYNTYTDEDTWTNIIFWGQNSDQANGEQKIALGGSFDVKEVQLWVPNPKENSNFSVAGFAGTSVPEPTPLILMGLVIFGLGALKRR